MREEKNANGIIIFGIRKLTTQLNKGLVNIHRAVYIFLGLLIVISIIGIYMVNSVSKSITGLESATKKIAAGDLDFKLKIIGNDEISSLERSFNIMREKLKQLEAYAVKLQEKRLARWKAGKIIMFNRIRLFRVKREARRIKKLIKAFE